MVYDRQGFPGKDEHYAVVNGVLQHSNLSHMRFDFDIDAYNILGYDVKDFGDEVFCGTAYATGNRVQRTAGQPEHQHRCPPRRKHHMFSSQPVLSNDFNRTTSLSPTRRMRTV